MTGESLRVELGERGYPIHIGAGLLSEPALFAPHLSTGRAVIVTNEIVGPLYAATLERTLAAPAYKRRQQTIWDGLFVGGLMTLLVAVVIGSLVAAILIAAWIAKRLGAAF